MVMKTLTFYSFTDESEEEDEEEEEEETEKETDNLSKGLEAACIKK